MAGRAYRAALEADPARFSGIVVLGVDASGYREIAAGLSATHAFRIPVCIVSSSGEPVLTAGAGDRVVVLPAASTYDVDAAREERVNLEVRIEAIPRTSPLSTPRATSLAGMPTP